MTVSQKMMSGRFLFTIACAVAFLYGVFTKMLSSDVVERIITVVLVFYFTKKDENGKSEKTPSA